MKQEMMGWQWHQLEHTQITCTLLQTDNHISTLSLNFYGLDSGCSSCHPTNSVKALKPQNLYNLSLSFFAKQVEVKRKPIKLRRI